MPISSFSIVSIIACELNSKNPLTVLDLGCGTGFYGAVIRQYCDLGGDRKVLLTGVESFNNYQNPNWQHYNKVYIRDIKTHLLEFENYGSYDTILFLDVIEHFLRNEGLAIADALKLYLKPNGLLLISTPGEFVAQGAEHGNELEKHLSFYTPEDFADRGFIILKDGRVKDELQQRMTIAKYVKR
jgi:2-polyprenyl-3-methyl-5-hydroxy-6-metoxy-1,4-benzoquinol methylase